MSTNNRTIVTEVKARIVLYIKTIFAFLISVIY